MPRKKADSESEVPINQEKPLPTGNDAGAMEGANVEGPVNETLKIDAIDDEPMSPSQSEGSRPPQAPPPATPTAPPPQPLSPSDARTWAMLAHLSVLANLVTGFLGPLIALGIYLAYKDRSRYVAYQSMQAFVFQMVWWVGAGILAGIAWTVSGLLAAILIGCCLMPFALIITFIPLAALVYGVIGAIETSQGKDFKYWLIGDWTHGTLSVS